MRPRFHQDTRALFWAFVLFPLVPGLGFLRPELLPWLLPLNFYLAYCSGVLTHNHNHTPVFTAKWMNEAYAAWLSIFYGCPIFTWIPTHNQNHHRYVDGPLDATRTSRRSPRNTLYNALSYPFWSAAWQLPAIREYVSRAKENSPAKYRQIVVQTAALVVAHGALIGSTLALHGLLQGGLIYVFSFGLPAASATYWMMLTNYLQHVECDTGSANNHSRNFVGRFPNWLTFEAGYHTVHHENPGTHWSEYPSLHALRAADIHPSLNQSSIFSYCFRRYFPARQKIGSDSAVGVLTPF